MTSVRHVPEPVGYLEDLIHGFREGARDGGMHLDADLCLGIAEGLGDVLDGLEVRDAVIARIRTAFAPPPEPPRTAAERRTLARLAAPLDPERRVLAFPLAGRARR